MRNKRLFQIMATLLLVLSIVAMAQAALTVSITKRLGEVDSEERTRYMTVTFDNSYASGGESLTASDMALATIHNVSCQPVDQYTFEYDYASNDLEVWNTSTDAAASGDLATVSTRCVARGK